MHPGKKHVSENGKSHSALISVKTGKLYCSGKDNGNN